MIWAPRDLGSVSLMALTAAGHMASLGCFHSLPVPLLGIHIQHSWQLQHSGVSISSSASFTTLHYQPVIISLFGIQAYHTFPRLPWSPLKYDWKHVVICSWCTCKTHIHWVTVINSVVGCHIQPSYHWYPFLFWFLWGNLFLTFCTCMQCMLCWLVFCRLDMN